MYNLEQVNLGLQQFLAMPTLELGRVNEDLRTTALLHLMVEGDNNNTELGKNAKEQLSLLIQPLLNHADDIIAAVKRGEHNAFAQATSWFSSQCSIAKIKIWCHVIKSVDAKTISIDDAYACNKAWGEQVLDVFNIKV